MLSATVTLVRETPDSSCSFSQDSVYLNKKLFSFKLFYARTQMSTDAIRLKQASFAYAFQFYLGPTNRARKDE